MFLMRQFKNIHGSNERNNTFKDTPYLRNNHTTMNDDRLKCKSVAKVDNENVSAWLKDGTIWTDFC